MLKLPWYIGAGVYENYKRMIRVPTRHFQEAGLKNSHLKHQQWNGVAGALTQEILTNGGTSFSNITSVWVWMCASICGCGQVIPQSN